MNNNPFENNYNTDGFNPETTAESVPETEPKTDSPTIEEIFKIPEDKTDTTPDYTPDEYYNPNNVNKSEPSENKTDTTPDYTPDEYYSQRYANQTTPAEGYARYGESYYGNTQPVNQPYAQQNYNTGYYQQPYYAQPQPVKPKPKKEKKPVTRGTIAAVLIISILCSTVLGAGGGFVAATFLGKNNSGLSTLEVSKSNGDSSSYASSTAELTTTEIVKRAADSVVEITTEQVATSSFSRQYIQQGAGSGVIISTDGYIITNYHVIEGASHITVTLRNQTEYTEVDVIGTYSEGDIALLKVKPDGELTAATFGNSDKISVGDYAVAIGNPLGQLGGTVTDGIISALDRELTIDDVTMNLLQTNAEISPGNSGGGLFNGSGELIGIVNAKSASTSAEGIGFAIPINDVQNVLSDLKQYGYVKGQIDLGMSLTDISSTAQLWMYGTSQTGVYVTSVNNGSNAASAGFRSGDIITKINGTEVTSTKEVKAIIKKLKVGDTAIFGVYRSGRTGTIKMQLQEYTKDSVTTNNNTEQFDDGFPWSIFN
ncbi:MAG: trypsin-like peptidase domain-containing protein [Ruminococcus sp.]|nr:trypsin-like peptidase domain-containing protein [Ruminococcus sp.]